MSVEHGSGPVVVTSRDISNILDNISHAISANQKLRSSVTNIYSQLKDGVKPKTKEHAKETLFVTTLKRNLVQLDNDFSELEKLSAVITKPPEMVPMGNTGLLSLDPIQDKTPIYNQLIQSYKWSAKLRDHASYAHSLLTQSTPKKSSIASGLVGKRHRQLPTSHISSPQSIDILVNGLDRQYPDMQISAVKPSNSITVLQVTLARTLKALVILRSVIIEKVVVKGYHENIHQDDGKLDIWSKSQHKVFQKISDHSVAAMLHYHLPLLPDVAVKSFMQWLHCYSNLFSSPCSQCHKYLDDSLPPTWRDFRSLEPYHENCRRKL